MKLQQSGFTLLEVMLGMAILAIALSGIMTATFINTRNLNHLQDKTLSHWVGMNAITELQLSQQRITPVTRRGSEIVFGREFFWTMDIAATGFDHFYQLAVSVGPNANEPRAFLVAYARSYENAQ